MSVSIFVFFFLTNTNTNTNMLWIVNLISIFVRKQIRIIGYGLDILKTIHDVNRYECNLDSYKYKYDTSKQIKNSNCKIPIFIDTFFFV